MTRTSTFALATLAAIAVTSLASTAASAHGLGGGGHSFASGFTGSASPVGHISPTGGFAHAPVNATGIARSSVVPRLVGSTGGHSNIPTTTAISQFPKAPTTPPPPPGKNNKPGWGRGGFVGFASVDVSADNCLVKQYLPNGRVMFRDICTRETALSR